MLHILLSVVLVAPAGTPLDGREMDATCRGQRATIIVLEGDDPGTAKPDVIVVGPDAGTVYGSGGDDLICVFGGETYHGVTIHGGPGNDTIVTYGGSNEITGDDGNDIVYLNGNGEHVEGGDGDDHVWGLGATGVYLYGQGDNDLLQGSNAADLIDGGDGVDLLIGAGGVDDLDGGSGTDKCQDAANDGVYAGCEELSFPLPEAG